MVSTLRAAADSMDQATSWPLFLACLVLVYIAVDALSKWIDRRRDNQWAGRAPHPSAFARAAAWTRARIDSVRLPSLYRSRR
jgi:hypothetical protein